MKKKTRDWHDRLVTACIAATLAAAVYFLIDLLS